MKIVTVAHENQIRALRNITLTESNKNQKGIDTK